MKKVCPICLKRFETPYNFKKYCSRQCKNKAAHLPKIHEKICAQCGATFTTKNDAQIYCSGRCADKHFRQEHPAPPRKVVKKTCPICGVEFETIYRQKRYCSKKCCVKSFNDRRSKTYIKTCAVCGKQFTATYNLTVYCSQTCRRQAERARYNANVYTRTCAYCNGEFTTRNPKRMYCSATCQRAAAILNARLEREAKREAYRQAALNKPAPVTELPPDPPKPKVIIPAAEAENRKPTVDELLDWIFSKGATA